MAAETLVRPEVTLLEDGHRDYADVDELVDHLSELYPDAEIGPETELTVIEWGEVQRIDIEAFPTPEEHRRQLEGIERRHGVTLEGVFDDA